MKINVVWGPPASGKSTYVTNNKVENNLIFDFDMLMRSLSGLAPHKKNDNLISYLLSFRKNIIEKLKDEKRLDMAWIITTWVDDDFKAKFAEHENVEYILIDTPKEECIRRVEENEDRQEEQDKQIEIIEQWFEKYEEYYGDKKGGAENSMGNKFWKMQKKDESTGEVSLYGIIASQSWYGDEITPKQFEKDLNALGDVSKIKVYINSEGGDVFAAQAIYSMLRRHKAHVTVCIDGLAASAASLIAMAGDTIYMPQNAMLMIHNPWTLAMGNANDFRKIADDLDKIRESVIAAYTSKSENSSQKGMTKEQIIEMMDAETWLTAEDAYVCGLCDEVEEQKQIAASISGNMFVVNGQKMDLSRYKNVPQLVAAPEVQNKEVRKWTKASAKEWLSEHDFKNSDYEEIANYHAFRQTDPGKYSEFRMDKKPFGGKESDGIVVVYGIYTEEGERKSEIQSIKFWHGEEEKEEDSGTENELGDRLFLLELRIQHLERQLELQNKKLKYGGR